MKTLALTLLATLFAGVAHAQPTRLIQAADLQHLGSFTLANAPATCWAGTFDTAYVQGSMAFNPANGSLFVVGHGVCQGVGEWTIPALGGVASVRQQPMDVTSGKIGQINPSDPGSKAVGALLVRGDRLVAAAYSTYDGNGAASSSHFVRSATLSNGTATGPFRVGNYNPAFYASYMAPVPSVWQAALGGDVLTGGCCLSIISRTSFGPSVSAVNSADLVAARNPTPATMLVGYPSSNKTLGEGVTQSAVFSQTSTVRGVVLPEGTASVLFFGRHGTGAYCYGEVPAQCSDPAISYKGGHAYPYVPYVWAYRASDLADVKAGRKQPWDVTPYATFRLPSQITGHEIGGVTVDPATGRIFVLDVYGGGQERPRIHVLSVRDGGTAPPPPAPVDAVVSAWGEWTGGAWSACSAGTQTRTETRTRTVVTPAANGGSTPTLSETRTASQSCVVEPPPPPPPPVDPCVATPGVLTVSSWPSTSEGSRQVRYSYTVAGVVVTVRSVSLDFTKLTVIDSRGCSTVRTR